jgi:IS30 family transposase
MIKNRRMIWERPAEADQRLRLGDWEGDLIAGSDGANILSLVDRKARFTILEICPNKTAQCVNRAAMRALKTLPDEAKKTLTVDNGKEFAQHEKLSERLGIDIFFANPYSPWERGTNENTNGLVRQYLPKGTAFKTLRRCQVKVIQDMLNSRPRKTLGFRTPARVVGQILSLPAPLRSALVPMGHPCGGGLHEAELVARNERSESEQTQHGADRKSIIET